MLCLLPTKMKKRQKLVRGQSSFILFHLSKEVLRKVLLFKFLLVSSLKEKTFHHSTLRIKLAQPYKNCTSEENTILIRFIFLLTVHWSSQELVPIFSHHIRLSTSSTKKKHDFY